MSHVLRARIGALLSVFALMSLCAYPAPGLGSASGAQPPEPLPVVQSVSSRGELEPEPEPEPEVPEETIPVYDFSQPVPETAAVDNSYFADAAFVGDSRTDGFLLYSGIGCGENLTSNGISIFQLDEKKAFKRNGVSYTLLEALGLKEYGKVYLSLGVNELGIYNDQGFYQAYCDAIDTIRALQPNAVIYIQGLIPLNEDAVKASGGPGYLENSHLSVYNDLMKKAAQEKQVAFLDLNPEFTDENGQLPFDASWDGVHLRSDYCKKWLEYLKIHTIDFETLYPNAEVTNDETIYYSASGGVDDPFSGGLRPDGASIGT